MPESHGTQSTIPSRIGRYRILEMIGRGAMGVVYSAQDETMGRPVALKVLVADLEGDPETRERFYREAQAAARLLHPNIITIFDAGEDRGRSFIAMQLLEGWSLAEYLKRPEAASLERKLDLMIQICEGLTAAHNQGIVHRDLKPSNLFVQPDGLLKILDFGVARFVGSNMTMTGTLLGTLDYMSPEQARGETVDARSDIFSAGAVFYFILSGRKPFPGDDFNSVFRRLQFEDPLPIGLPGLEVLETVVGHAMAKDPEARIGRIEDVLTELHRFRRQYAAATRKLLASAQSTLNDFAALLSAFSDLGFALGLPPDTTETAALESVRQEFPVLTGSASIEAVALDRGRVAVLLDDLSSRRARLAEGVEARRTLVDLIDLGQRALSAGDAKRALECFERVGASCPESARARQLVESARPLASEQEARERRTTAHTEAARKAIAAQQWATAADECRQALATIPGHEAATALLAEAEHGMSRQAAAEAAEALHQLSLDEIRRARGAFRRGRYDEAVQQLRGLLEVEPNAHGARSELERLIALRETLVSHATSSRRVAQELFKRAAPLTQAGALADAEQLLQEGLRADPTDVDGAAALDVLIRRQLDEDIARDRARASEQRTRAAEPLLAAARAALRGGYLELALKGALAAQRLLVDKAEISGLIEEIRDELASEDDEAFELGSPPDTPEPMVAGPSPRSDPVPRRVMGGMLDWATGLFRGRSQRRKA